MFFNLFRPFFLITLFILPSLAQQPFAPPSTHSKRTYDAQHYVIRTRLDHAKKELAGQTTVLLKPLAEGFISFELDAAGMTIESITLDKNGAALEKPPEGGTQNKALNFKLVGEKLIVTLDRAYSPSALISVTVKYTVTEPKKGVYFVSELKDRNGKLIHPRQAWTQGEAEESHYWFPSYDYPDDKATTEQYLTVPAGEIAIANGELLGAAENPDGTKTFHYKMPVPHSTYLTSFVTGDFARVEGKFGDVPLGYYLYHGTEDVAEGAYGKTPLMMETFEKLTGVKYPYNKYDQTVVAEFKFGGMENITATTMADSEIFAARLALMRPFVEDLVSHELAHSWFGNLVTCKTWSQLWLNEGFATFMEAAFKEHEGGRSAYLEKVRNDAGRYFADEIGGSQPHALVNKYAQPNEALFDVTTYQKGGVVIYMLRETLGDEIFWKAVNIYLNRHKFDNVETADLQAAMEEASGQDLDWFFNQWVYGTSYPDLRVKSSYNSRKKTLSLEVQQVQKARPDAVAVFTLPVDIEIATAKGAVKQKININQPKQVFQIPLQSAPKKISFDKDEKIMLKKMHFSGTVPIEGANLSAQP